MVVIRVWCLETPRVRWELGGWVGVGCGTAGDGWGWVRVGEEIGGVCGSGGGVVTGLGFDVVVVVAGEGWKGEDEVKGREGRGNE